MSTSSPFEVAAGPAMETAAAAHMPARDRVPRVLVIRRRYLGDIVLLGSVLKNLRLHWPAAWITVLTEAAYAGVLRLMPEVDAELTVPRHAREWLGFARKLRRVGFTHVLDLDNANKTAVITRLTGAPLRATLQREHLPFRHSWTYTHTAKITDAFYNSHHITETYLALPAAVGVPIRSREVRLTPRPQDIAGAQKLIARGGNKVLVHPGSRSASRVWPVERFADVCDRLQDNLGAQVFLTAGPGEQSLVKQIQAQTRTHVVVLDPPRDVGQLAALLGQFDAFLCHDSGPMHVAAAVGTPVVALFGSQNATIWRPLGPRHTILQTPLPCACIGSAAPVPCKSSDSYRSYCVRKLAADDVFAAITRTLATGR
jgi:ADP-heptose:LPS heptosyltransferase